MTWILPLIILVVYFKGYYDYFSPKGTALLVGWMIFAVILVLTILLIAFRQPAASRRSLIRDDRPHSDGLDSE